MLMTHAMEVYTSRRNGEGTWGGRAHLHFVAVKDGLGWEDSAFDMNSLSVKLEVPAVQDLLWLLPDRDRGGRGELERSRQMKTFFINLAPFQSNWPSRLFIKRTCTSLSFVGTCSNWLVHVPRALNLQRVKRCETLCGKQFLWLCVLHRWLQWLVI